MRRPGKHHHRATLNAVAMAINGARRLSAADVDRQYALAAVAIEAMDDGLTPSEAAAQHWRSLVDTCNVAQTLAGMGLGGGPEAQGVLDASERALIAIHGRAATTDVWQSDAADADALMWLLELHAVQLSACSYREFETAYRRTRDRLAQALAGNATPGATVLTGDVGVVADEVLG